MKNIITVSYLAPNPSCGTPRNRNRYIRCRSFLSIEEARKFSKTVDYKRAWDHTGRRVEL